MSRFGNQLQSDELHVWQISLAATSGVAVRLRETLSPEEQHQARCFCNPIDGDRYTIAHSALRDLLGRYTDQSPCDLQIAHTAEGKPYLVGNSEHVSLHFSLSHSASRALVAVSHTRPVGVDLERIDPEVEVLAVAERFFSRAEYEAMVVVADSKRLEHFFRLWVCKEAYVKARGEGIIDRLSTFTVSAEDADHMCLVEDTLDSRTPSLWRFYTLEVSREYAGALAVQGTPTQVRFMNWEPEQLTLSGESMLANSKYVQHYRSPEAR